MLLAEELWVDAEFRQWILAACGIDASDHSLVSVQRSVTQSSGESDLVIAVLLGTGETVHVYIENKVDAGFQRDQARRYRERATTARDAGECAIAVTLLLAPTAYFGSSVNPSGFDFVRTYEDLLDWFGRVANRRADYRYKMIRAAVNKSRLGYNPVPNDRVSEFWRAYWEVARDVAPELGMDEPGGRPGGSVWIYFRAPSLPRKTYLVHKVDRGFIELTIDGAATLIPEIVKSVGPLLENGMTIARSAKSAGIRLPAPALEMAQRFESQADRARAAILLGAELLRWTERHRDVLVKFTKSPKPASNRRSVI